MTRKMKRTLSLVLALIMICSTMSVMAFAQEASEWCHFCDACKEEVSCRKTKNREFNRVIECPLHDGAHDAEEYYVYVYHYCPNCNQYFDCDVHIERVCVW